MDETPCRNPNSHTVWLDEQTRIASFHHVAGYEKRSFTCHKFFMGFLHSLQERDTDFNNCEFFLLLFVLFIYFPTI